MGTLSCCSWSIKSLGGSGGYNQMQPIKIIHKESQGQGTEHIVRGLTLQEYFDSHHFHEEDVGEMDSLVGELLNEPVQLKKTESLRVPITLEKADSDEAGTEPGSPSTLKMVKSPLRSSHVELEFERQGTNPSAKISPKKNESRFKGLMLNRVMKAYSKSPIVHAPKNMENVLMRTQYGSTSKFTEPRLENSPILSTLKSKLAVALLKEQQLTLKNKKEMKELMRYEAQISSSFKEKLQRIRYPSPTLSRRLSKDQSSVAKTDGS